MDSENMGHRDLFKVVSWRISCAVVFVIILSSPSISASERSRGIGTEDRVQLNGPETQTSLKTHLTRSGSIGALGADRMRRQLPFFEWFFGSPAKSNATHHPHENHTASQNITHKVHGKNPAATSSNKEQAIVGYRNPVNNSVVHYPSVENVSDSTLPSGPIFAKPRIASDRFNNSRQMEITDIQTSVGTELNEGSLNSDPSQVNLQEELDAIDRLEKNLSDATGLRKRRESQAKNKFRQINIPYGSPANGINSFSKRQLFMTPEQQMLLLRQQQEIAAATMLQQQLLSVNNRYNNRYIDDYYEDDSSYEDSDEPYEDFNRYGMHIPSMNRGALFGGGVRGHPMGIGRRSLPDEESDPNSKKQVKGSRVRRPSGGDSMGSISKGGRWETIEDYDLSSNFNTLQSRRGKPEGSSPFLGDSHKELDESDEQDEMTQSFRNRGRNGILGRQDLTTIATPTTAPATEQDPSTTPGPMEPTSSFAPDESSTSTTQAGESSSTTEGGTTESSSTTTGEIGSTTEAEDIVTTEAPVSETTTGSSTTASSTQTPDTTNSPTLSTTSTSTSSPSTPSTSSPTNTSTPTTKKPKPSTTKKPKPSTTTEKPMLPPFHQTLNCKCGVQSVRGETAEDGTVIRTMVNPWLVSVSTRQKHLCSGSIINNKYILTSKQCVKGMKGLIITAGMGSRASKNFTVTNINPHESRNIALLKVKPAITPNHAMRPICLPIKKKNNGATPATGTLVTFKKSSSRINSPIQLVQTEVPILSGSECASPTTGDLPPGTICPGPPASLKCGGDTGGVLQIYQRGYSYEQIGVVANTVGCRANKAAGVYTDMRKSVKWIMYNTKDARYCRKPKVSLEDLMNTKKSDADNEPQFLPQESEDELSLEDEPLGEEDDEAED